MVKLKDGWLKKQIESVMSDYDKLPDWAKNPALRQKKSDAISFNN